MQALREPLLAQLDEPGERRRPRRRLLAPAVASVLVASAAGWLALAPRTQPALAIDVTPSVVELRIQRVDRTGEEMTRALRDAGVRGYVIVAPVPPEQAGHWVAWGETAGLRPRSRCLDRREPAPVVTRLSEVEADGGTLRVPAGAVRDSTGAFFFVAGRAAREGEQVAVRGGRVDFEALPPGALPGELRELLVMPPSGGACP